MPTTTNFGWTTPADTDLVKDGASAIRTLGNGVDTSFVDLKGGTTGQILSKASNTDLDFTWTAATTGDITEVQAGVGISIASGTGPIPVITNSSTDLITTAGDLLYGTAADTVARLGIGTAGQVLTVNSGATAPQWSTSSVKVVQIVTGTTNTETSSSSNTYVDTNLTATITPTSASNTILVLIGHSTNRKSGTQRMYMRLMRGATAIGGTWQYGDTSNTAVVAGLPIIYSDSPATTSATTYKTQFQSADNGADVTVQYNNGRSTIVLVEVAP
jgi:hypothetical protein